jgi:putative peptide zinc metalloprotease protein
VKGPLFSASWYRVAGLTPRLRSHAQIHRHEYRERLWYVLQDHSTQRFHRFSPPAYLVIGLMDGRRTVQEIWDVAQARLDEEAPTQDELIQLLGQLHAADVLQCDVPPDAAEVLRRHDQQRERRWRSQLLSVLSWRVPVMDPERFLQRTLPLVRPLLGWTGALIWLSVVGAATVVAAAHWTDLTRNVVDQVLAPTNLLLLWLAFPLVKLLHELGHAYATRAFGGEVHDLGIMILVLTPVPYVDASAASAFRSKWQRILVGAAGMLVELFLAALALFVWLNAQPGAIRALAYNVIFIASVSTIVFNANPLLRFDGYYILADLLEIPNLRDRARAYVGYLGERYLFGRRDAEPAEASPGERVWFVIYTPASFVYRMLVTFGIVLFIAAKFFVVGVVMAALAVVAWAIVPVAKGLKFLFTSPRLRRVRGRAVTVSAGLAAALVALVAVVPVPFRSRAEGVVWIPDEAVVRASVDGFIDRVVAQPGSRVARGAVLIVCRDPLLAARVEELAARLRELEARYTALRVTDRVKAEIVREEIAYVTATLARERERLDALTIRSGSGGTFVAPLAVDLPGRFVKRGEVLAHIVDLATVTVRVVVPQVDADLVQHRTHGIEVRLAERIAETVPAVVARAVPAASERLPSMALGLGGGGHIATDPTDSQGLRTLERMFQLDLRLPVRQPLVNAGGRVYVRFDHGRAPLASQWYRQIRQIFLARFYV